MPSVADNEWTIVDLSTTRTNTMASTDNITPAPVAEHPNEEEGSIKPVADEKKGSEKCTCDASKPKLARQDSIESINSVDDYYRRPRRIRPNNVRRYSVSPVRIRQPVVRDATALITSSSLLLDKVSKYDGIADLPFPARGSVYLATFPFTDKDVKKWSWLFSLGIEDTFLAESGRGRAGEDDSDSEDACYPNVRPVRRGRDRSPFYDPVTIDIPSVFLSRALDTAVIPEDAENVRYVIVTQNRHRPAGSKLLVAENRKAAGMLMYYELLKGDSIMFVGGTMQQPKKTIHPKKFKKVESFEEAVKVQDEGFVGVVC